MSLLLLLRNRPAPKSLSTKDYAIWDQQDNEQNKDPGPQQQKTVESTLQNQLGFLMRKTWRTPTPVGCIMQYVGNTAPIGWLLCDGASYSISNYPDLYEIIGDTYGGSSVAFNVPNFAGRVPVGEGSLAEGSTTYTHEMGDVSGETYHVLTVGEMPSHNHDISDNGHYHTGTTDVSGSHTHTGTADISGDHTHDHNGGGGDYQGATGLAISSNFDTPGSIDDDGGQEVNVKDIATLEIQNAGNHGHNLTINPSGDHKHGITTTTNTTGIYVKNTGGGLKHNNMQPYVVVRYIIKW
jgi:microcystin-dependent protein